MKQFMPLRQDTEKRAAMIRTASERHAAPPEACKIISSFAQAELKLLNFVKIKSKSCGIPPEVAKQMTGSHARTEQLRTKVCAMGSAPQGGGGPPAPSLSEAIGAPVLPDAADTPKRTRGSTFDTISGNVLSR